MSSIEMSSLAKSIDDNISRLDNELVKNRYPNNLAAKDICNMINRDIDRILSLVRDENKEFWEISIKLDGKFMMLDEFLFNVKMLASSRQYELFNFFTSQFP